MLSSNEVGQGADRIIRRVLIPGRGAFDPADSGTFAKLGISCESTQWLAGGPIKKRYLAMNAMRNDATKEIIDRGWCFCPMSQYFFHSRSLLARLQAGISRYLRDYSDLDQKTAGMNTESVVSVDQIPI
jgi:hypothetical protein